MISYPWRFTDTMTNKSLARSAGPAKYSVCLSLSIVLTYICALEPRSSAQPRTVMGANEYPALQSFRLDQPGEHVFRFRQTHSREMTLLLEVQGSTHEPDRQRLTHLRITIEATLLNHREGGWPVEKSRRFWVPHPRFVRVGSWVGERS